VNWTSVGYDGETIAFVEPNAHGARRQHLWAAGAECRLCETKRAGAADRHLHDCPTRFDVLAIDNIPGHPPEIRLHKDAFSPQLRGYR
jgi:hypothetical protein